MVRFLGVCVAVHFRVISDDNYNDAQPDASAAATSTANTTMHNPTAFHTAGVIATCATLLRLSTRTTEAKRSCSRLSPPHPLPLHPRYFLVRASFANKVNSTARGWGLGA